MEKWQVPDAHDKGYLKGQPKEVKAIFYELKDTTLHLKGKIKSQELFRFDEHGNVIFSQMLVDTFFNVESTFSYSDDGFGYRVCSKEKDSCATETIQTSQRINSNRFLLTKYRDGEKQYEELYSFEKDKVVRERVFSDKTKKVFIFWYQNGRLIKTHIQDDKLIEVIYYRDSKGFLDSVVTNHQKEIFINNEYGDPLFYFSLQNGDTSATQRFSYEYDEKGNWVRRTTFEKDSKSVLASFPEYSLLVREFKY